MGTSGPYSELEYLILAMVSEGRTSGYAMRKEMNRMKGGRWSSESGSVYRVLRRLEQDHLLRETGRVGVPNRERTEYELTPQGEALLHSWLTFPPDRAEFAFLVDPLRTRCYFLPQLKPAEQIRVVKTWMQENKQFTADLERDISAAKIGDPVLEVAYENLLFLAEARQAWLKKVLVTVRSQASISAGGGTEMELQAG
jgi:DNA-binding PadR family transcriptional regulator